MRAFTARHSITPRALTSVSCAAEAWAALWAENLLTYLLSAAECGGRCLSRLCREWQFPRDVRAPCVCALARACDGRCAAAPGCGERGAGCAARRKGGGHLSTSHLEVARGRGRARRQNPAA